MMVSGTMPGAVQTELFATPDWNAELSTEIAKMTDSPEAIPMPDVTRPSRKLAPPINVADNVRELLASDERSAIAFRLLCKLLHPKNRYSEEVAVKLQTVSNRLTVHIVNLLLAAYRPSKKSSKESDDLDMPRNLKLENPQQWTSGDVLELKNDLFFMTVPGSNLDIISIAFPQRGPRPPK
jgi:hypothetical protein